MYLKYKENYNPQRIYANYLKTTLKHQKVKRKRNCKLCKIKYCRVIWNGEEKIMLQQMPFTALLKKSSYLVK